MTSQTKPPQRNSIRLLGSAQLMILCLMAQVTTVFGLSFNVPLYTLTNNNTSACSNYSAHFGGLVAQNFGPTSVVDTSGDTININSNLVDMSLNAVTPGHVSHADVHSLIPSRPDLRWFANGTCWWGEGPSHHVDNGTTNTTAAYAAAMVADLESRGFNGLIFSWYGKGDQTDTVAKNVQQYLNSTNNTDTNFTITIMIVFGDFAGGEGMANVESNINYCQTQYFNDAHYEKEGGHPLLMFFNVSPAYFDNTQMAQMKSDTSSNTYWVQEGVGEIGQSWVNMTYLWTDDYDQANTNELSGSTPYNLNVVTNDYSTIKSNSGKQAYGAMCAHFNGTLTKSAGWSLGKYLPSGNGLCEYYRAQEINQVIPANMTRMQWATWSDYEEGTEVEVGTENYFGLTTSLISSNTLSWAITSGDERTIDHYEVYALTNGGNAAFMCDVANGTHQTNLTQLGLLPGNYQLYVDAVGLPCIRNHLSMPVAYNGPVQSVPAPWVSQDIGSVGVAGSASYTNGTFTVNGSGVDIWGTSDSFQFVYQPWSGDGQIVAQVVSMQNTASAAKAGLMFRETLNSGSADGDLFVTPTSGVSLQGRTAANASAGNVNTLTGITPPCWLKLMRVGNIMSGYESPDGTNWTLVGTNAYAMTNSIYVGLCVTSKSNVVLNASVFTNVVVTNINYYNYAASWPNPSSIVYGTALGTSQNDATAGVAGTFVYTPANGTILSAGTNVLTAVFTPMDPSYFATNLSATLVVTPAPLTITANPANKVYNTTLTLGAGQTAFTSSGLVLGQTVGSVTLASSGAVNTAPVGSYAITPSLATGGTFSPANYNLTYDNGTLTVSPGVYTAGWTNPSGIVYGTALGAGQNDATASVAGAFVYTPANGTTLPAGTNALTTVFTPTDTNYLGTNLNASLVVTPASLTITADSMSKLYGATLTLGAGQTAFTSAGLVLGQTVGSVTLTSSGAINTAPVGSYAIVPSLATGGSFSPANYNLTYDNGTLTVYAPQGLPSPWTNQDIGTVGLSGSASYTNGTFTVNGAGVDIWSTNDSFQFVYQPWTGDGQIVARVTAVQNTAPWAKAGLMFRETLNPGSADGDLFVTPSSGISMQGRTVANAAAGIVSTTTNLAAPYWLSLVRQGNYLYGYASPDGVDWTPVGTNVYSMTNSIYVGLCVTSKSNVVLNASMFDNVSVSGAWLDQDIGSVGVPGSSQINYSNGVFTVSGSGSDIWGSSDAFQYLYQSYSGDSSVIARVTSVEGTSPWAKAAVMIRETLATNSRNTILFLSPSNGVQLQGRTSTGGSTVAIVNVTNLAAPQWIQLVRSSQNLNAYLSADGFNWSWIGTQTNPMATSYTIGLAVTSKNNAALNTSTFDSVSIQSAWGNGDIGSVGVPGSTSIDNSNGTNSVYTVSGSGADIWSTNDAFQFVGQPLYGDGQIVARVLNVQNTNPWAKAGVMIRDTDAANAINALLFVSPASTNGISFQGRSGTGGNTSTFLSVSGLSAPYWLKLNRSGATLTAYRSSDGSSWTQVGSAQTLTMSTNALVGLAVCSKNNTTLNTSTFDNVTITPAP